MGLQSDGTAIIGDRLALSYGVTFGTPSAITWYKDGSVLKTWSSGNSGQEGLNQDGGLWKDVDAGDGAGTYSATVVAEGVTYTTNEIVVTTAEEAAEIIGFKIEDDYTDGTDILYDTKDPKAVATVTLKKNYDGKIAIYKANDNKFKGAIDTAKTSTAVATQATKYYVADEKGGENNAIAGNSVLTTDQATNFQILNLSTADAAVGHINADGSATYKFQVDDGVFTRGQNYVVVFDQASVVTDTPGTGIANVFDEEATVPYVEAPAAIAVTKVSVGNYPEVSFVDKDGNTLAWFGETTKNLSTSGIDKGEIYYAKSKLNDPEKGTKQGVKINTDKNVEKGVWKSDVKAAVNDDKYIDAYWFASVTTKKGIFGKDAVTLTSEAVPTAQKSADTINLVEDSTTATSATVKFTNLRADGTVYIVRALKERTEDGKYINEWDGDYYSKPEYVFKAYEAGINQAIVGKETVKAGAASVTVAQAIDEYVTNADDRPNAALGGAGKTGYFPINNYIAVFVPDDEDNYGMIYTASGFLNATTKEDSTKSDDSQGLTLGQVATTAKYTKTLPDVDVHTGVANGTGYITVTDTGLIAYDQFGKKMSTAQGKTDATSVTVTDKTVTTEERGVGSFTVDPDGIITVRLDLASGATNAIDKGDGFTIKVLDQEISIMAANAAVLANKTITDGLVVKVGSTTLLTGKHISAVGTTAAAAVTTATATAEYGTADITTTANKAIMTNVDGTTAANDIDDAGAGTASLYTDEKLSTAAGYDVDVTNAAAATIVYALHTATTPAGKYYFKWLGCTYTLTVAPRTLTAADVGTAAGTAAATGFDIVSGTSKLVLTTAAAAGAASSLTFSVTPASGVTTNLAVAADGTISITTPNTGMTDNAVVATITVTGHGNLTGSVTIQVLVDTVDANGVPAGFDFGTIA